jgi:hypothetical protein
MIKDICDLHLYSKCHFDKIKKDIDKYEEKFHNLRNLDDEIKKAKKEIEKAMENIITPEMKILGLFESKLDKFLDDTLNSILYVYTPFIQELVLYKDLQILKKFNKQRKVSENMCNDKKKDEELILQIYNNHIIENLNNYASNQQVENMTRENYYNIMKTQIRPLLQEEDTQKLIDELSEEDSLISLKFVNMTKHIICKLFN